MTSGRIALIGALIGAGISVATWLCAGLRIPGLEYVAFIVHFPGALLAWGFIIGDNADSGIELMTYGLWFSIPLHTLLGELPGLIIGVHRYFFWTPESFRRCLGCRHDLGKSRAAGRSHCPECGRGFKRRR